MRITTTAGHRTDDHFDADIHVPTGQYAYQQPTMHLRNSDQSVTMFLDIDEVRELLDVLTANADALQAANDRWAAERRAVLRDKVAAVMADGATQAVQS